MEKNKMMGSPTFPSPTMAVCLDGDGNLSRWEKWKEGRRTSVLKTPSPAAFSLPTTYSPTLPMMEMNEPNQAKRLPLPPSPSILEEDSPTTPYSLSSLLSLILSLPCPLGRKKEEEWSGMKMG